MKIIYTEGPSSRVLKGGIIAKRGEPVEVPDDVGVGLIGRGDGMFEEAATADTQTGPRPEHKEDLSDGN